MKFKMRQVLSLLFPLLFHTASGRQKSSGTVLQCSDYLRCRSDELEVRWKCFGAHQSLFTDVCRTERHIRSLKALVMRSESDFSGCIATEAHSIEDAERPKEGLCSERLSIPLRPSCAELRSFSTSRCEALKKCCTVTEKCEKQQHTTSIMSMLVAQRTTVSMLLRGCLSGLASSSVSNKTRKSDSNSVRAVTSALDLMQGLEELSDRTSHEPPNPAHKRAQSVATAVDRRDSNNVTETPSSPITSHHRARNIDIPSSFTMT